MTALLLVEFVHPASELPDDQFKFAVLQVPEPSCGELACEPLASHVKTDASSRKGSSTAIAKPSIFTERCMISRFRISSARASNYVKRKLTYTAHY